MNESEQSKLQGFCLHGNFPGECLACREEASAREHQNAPKNLEQSLNSHLAKGVRPIMTSIGSFEDYKDLEREHPELPNLDTDMDLKSATNVNWHADNKALAENDLLNAGEYTYVISKIDSANKLSRQFGGCTGLVVAGTETESGKNISFLTHQNLGDMTQEKKEEFLKHMEQRFAEIKNRCTPGTIDVVVVGGEQMDIWHKKYSKAIKLITEVVKKDMGFEPVVIGPKIDGAYDNIYYQNDNRHLSLVRSNVNPKVSPFLGGQIDEKRNTWK